MTGTGQGVAVVTGASGPIGAAIARMLGERGHDLVLLGRDPERLAQTEAACGAGRALVLPCDLGRPEAVDAAVQRLRAEAGAPRVLVHAAGVFDWASAEAADPEAWAGLMQVNLLSVMRLTAALAPALLSHPGSAVVLVASMAGHQAFANNAAYVASKHGLVGFGRALFLDLRDRGVKVSLVSPGLVAAGASLSMPGGRPERFLRPEDVAEAVRYVLDSSPGACPTEIRLEPQLTPTGGGAGD